MGVLTGWSKQGTLGDALMRLAHERGPDARMPTVRELCATFGVSTSTLDAVMRSLERRGAIVRRHGSGIFVSPTIRLKTIGVVFGGDVLGERASPFWGLLLDAVRAQASKGGIRPQAYLDISTQPVGLGGHAQLVEDLAAGRLDGVLLLSPRAGLDEAVALRRYGVPVVVFGHDAPDGWSVRHDEARFHRLAARTAAEVGGPVAFLGMQAQSELVAFAEVLRQAGAGDNPPLDWTLVTWGKRLRGFASREEFARKLVADRIADRDREALPSVLVSTDDTFTRGAITAMLEAGLRPGRDLTIVTAANAGSSVLSAHAECLVQIAYDPTESIRAALGMLTILMAGGTPPEHSVRVAPRRIPPRAAVSEPDTRRIDRTGALPGTAGPDAPFCAGGRRRCNTVGERR